MERQILLNKLIQSIRSSLDINEIKKNTVIEIGKAFSTDRCFIRVFDAEQDSFLLLDEYSEYLSSPDVDSIIELAPVRESHDWIKEGMKAGKEFLIPDIDALINEKSEDKERMLFFQDKYKLKSVYGFPMFYSDKLLAALVLNYTKSIHYLNKEDIKLLKTVADQIGVSLHHANLYEKVKKTAKRESLLRNVIDGTRTTLDIDKLMDLIVDSVGKALNPSRCFIIEFDKNTENFKNIQNEYLSSDKIKSLKDRSIYKGIPEVAKLLSSGKDIIIPDAKAFLNRLNLQNSLTASNFKDYSILSCTAIPIFYRDKFLGILINHYDKINGFNEDDIEFLKTVANQAGIAIHQAKLYEKEKQTAKQEKLLREIIGTIRSSIDINKLKHNIVNQIGKTLEADRCVIIEFNSETEKFITVDEHSQYLSSPEISSHVGINLEEGELKEFKPIFEQEKRDVFIPDFDNPPENENSIIVKNLRKFKVKSNYGFRITYGENLLGVLYLNYVKIKKIYTEDEINFLKTLAYQAGIAIHHAKLYQQEKHTAEREKLLRNLTETIRSTLDINEVLSKISEEISKVFSSERVTITQFPNKSNYQEFLLRKEYKRTNNVKSIFYSSKYKEVAEFWGKKLLDEEEIISLYNIEESDTPQFFKDFYKKLDVKSIIGIPIKTETEKWGMLVLSQLERFRYWSKEETDLLKTISGQIFIAIKQAELLEETKLNAKREKLLSEINSIAKSTLNIEEILTLISKKIEKFYGAEKVDINLNSSEIIQIVSPKIIKFKEEDKHLLENIANNISLAVKESDLYSRSKFFSDVSHELRTPLAIIDGYANNLLDRNEYSPETVDKYLNTILKNTKRMINIIENLTTLSQLETGKEENIIDLEEASIEKVIRNVTQIQENIITTKNVQLETLCESPLTCRINSLLLEQALLNLVKNAVQYSNENSKVIIKGEKVDNKVSISVQDFGIGIEEKHLANIFKRFYRIDKSRSREVGGSGLGLSIVENIVKAHSGKVRVVSEPGKGSIFSIEIPCF